MLTILNILSNIVIQHTDGNRFRKSPGYSVNRTVFDTSNYQVMDRYDGDIYTKKYKLRI
jgi:hypothetical protein